jgi:hypothetical protein
MDAVVEPAKPLPSGPRRRLQSVGDLLDVKTPKRQLRRWFGIEPAKFAVLIASFCVFSSSAVAQSVEKEPIAVVELGGAASRSLNDGGSGPTFAVEITPIENWLELEAGVTPLFNRSSTEWDTDLLFKKPWTLSDKAEFMLGAGPEWVHTNKRGATANSISAEVALDFMFWPSARHRFGWYLEPGFDRNFGRGHEQSFAISGGLLIAIP